MTRSDVLAELYRLQDTITFAACGDDPEQRARHLAVAKVTARRLRVELDPERNQEGTHHERA